MAKRKKAETETADEPKGVKSHSWMLAQLKAAQDADHDNRTMAREAAVFLHKRGGQWEDISIARDPNEPKYSFDLTSPIIDQVQRTMDRSDYEIKVLPGGGGASKDVAETYDGLVRNIQNISNANETYSRAGRSMAVKGLDGWEVVQAYIDGDSFDQDLLIAKVPNWLDSVWLGPHTEQDGSDAKIAWKLVGLTKEEFEGKYPGRSTSASVSSDATNHAYFHRTDLVMVGRFYYLESSERTLVMMSNGMVFEAESEEYKSTIDDMTKAGVTEMRRRKRTKQCVYIRDFDANDWIDEKPNKTAFENWIPLIPCYGNFDFIDDGKLVYYGAVEKLMDPQRIFNYSLTREVKEGVLAPRAKYWMTDTQIKGHEESLAKMNTSNAPVQRFNHDPDYPGAPQQNGGAQINAGLARISESMQALVGNTSGVFSAGMGEAQSFAQSADTINALQDKSDAGSNKYIEARTIAQRHTGRILVDAIPRVYLPDRQVRILGEDGSFDMVTIGQQMVDQQTGKTIVMNDLSQGQYDVTCVVGPSFQNRQSQTVTALTEVGAIAPEAVQNGTDILLKNISSPGMDQLAAREHRRLLLAGMIPEDQMTDEDKQFMQQMQNQPQQEDPNMVLARAEEGKAQAQILKAQTEQVEVQNKQQIDAYNAETDRMKVDIERAKALAAIEGQHANVGKVLAETNKIRLETVATVFGHAPAPQLQ